MAENGGVNVPSIWEIRGEKENIMFHWSIVGLGQTERKVATDHMLVLKSYSLFCVARL